jgi:hypothetical protein
MKISRVLAGHRKRVSLRHRVRISQT